MSQETLYYQYNPWWEGETIPADIFPRQQLQQMLEALIPDRSIVFLTGLRRIGKSTLMKLLIGTLLNSGIDRKHIFYISLDDYLLRDKSILDIITAYRKLHRLAFDIKVFVFLDEVAYKKDFRVQLKNLYDTHHLKIFASTSSTSAFRDAKGLLTGRERVIEIPPLNFEEFLLFKNIQLKKRDAILLDAYFEDYLKIGGIPEYVLHTQREYLVSLIEDILYKDIIGYYNVKNPQIIKDFFTLLMERSGKQISINKIANILGIAPDSAKRYLQMFVDTFLVDLVPRYGKTNTMILSPKKLYAADIGIKNLFTGFRDKGAIFENLVFLLIKRLQPRYVYESGVELDFFTENKLLIEAKYGQELKGKQLELFNSFRAEKKLLVCSWQELHNLELLVGEKF